MRRKRRWTKLREKRLLNEEKRKERSSKRSSGRKQMRLFKCNS